MDGKAPHKSVLYKSGADLRESQQSSDSQGWVIVDCTDSDKKTPVWVAKKRYGFTCSGDEDVLLTFL